MNQGVWSRPAQCGKCQAMASVVNWHHTTKDLLIDTD